MALSGPTPSRVPARPAVGAAATRHAERHARDRALVQFAIAAWVVLLALGFVLVM